MLIFVSEYLTSGACPDIPLDSSLMREGRLMADALLADFEAIDGVQTLTTRDPRFLVDPEQLRRETFPASAPEAERELFETLTHNADAVIIIAPETDNLLADRVRTAIGNGDIVTVLNCQCEAIAQCADKLTLPNRLRSLSASVIPAAPIDFTDDNSVPFDLPVVVKPRFGAGCEQTHYIATPDAWNHTIDSILTLQASDDRQNWIVQPFAPGVSLSSVALYRHDGSLQAVLPLGTQHIQRTSNRLNYRGGTLPWISPGRIAAAEQNEQFFMQLGDVLPGLKGYVGADWIWDETQEKLHLVELNPRLTTSYLGYRELYGTQIAAALLDSAFDQPLICDEEVLIRFDVDGTLERSVLHTLEQSGELLP